MSEDYYEQDGVEKDSIENDCSYTKDCDKFSIFNKCNIRLCA